MQGRDIARLLLTLDKLETPVHDPIRMRIEAILIKARVEAKQRDRNPLMN